jgi:hypothetical protein
MPLLPSAVPAWPALDVTVIGFDAVIAVAPCPLATPSFHAAISLELTNGGWVTAQSVAREYLRRSVFRVRQCPLQEQLGGLTVPCLGQVEINRLATAIHGAKQIHPLAGDPHGRLIHMPSG